MGISRRSFLRTGARAGVGALGLGVLPSPIRPMTDELRIGIIGLGWQGLRLLRELLVLKHVSVAGLCDINAETLHAAAQWVASPVHTTTAVDTLVSWTELDGVIVATPDHTHGEIALAAVEAGKDVYLETPMTRTLDQAAALVDAVTRYRRIVQVSSPLLNHPRILAAQESIRSGLLGQSVQITVALQTQSPHGAPQPRATPEWVWNPDNANPARLFAPYLDVIHRLFDLSVPDHIIAHGGVKFRQNNTPSTNPDVFYGVLDYPEGIIVNLYSGVVQPLFTLHGSHRALDLHALTPDDGNSHLAEWLTSVRSRTEPLMDVRRGAQQSSVLHRLELAYGDS